MNKIDNSRKNFGLFPEVLIVLLITFVALIIRVYKLDEIPPGNWYDEAINGLDALSILKSKIPPIFFSTEGHPREALYMYLTLLTFKIFGVSYITLRLTSVIVGTLTIPILYLFAKEFFDRKTAFLSIIILTVFRWHIHFSRLAFRTVLTPLFLLLVFYFLKKGFVKKKTIFFIVAGICFGLGFYTYLAFRLIILILVIYLIAEFRKYSVKEYSRYLFLFILSAIIIFVPLLVDYVIHPFHLFGRSQEISLFKNGFADGINLILLNMKNVAMMFAFKGDHVAKHNIPFKPVFDPIIAMIFYLGLTMSILKMKKSPSYLLIVSWFFVMLLTTILSYGSPNMLRSFAITPVCAIFIAIGIYTITDKMKNKFSSHLSVIFIVIILCYFSLIELHRYFVIWAHHPKTYLEFNTNFADAARTLNEVYTNESIFVYEPLFKHPTFNFETVNYKSKYATFRRREDGEFQFSQEPTKGSLILATDWDGIYNSYLWKHYPDGKIIGGFKLPDNHLWAIVFQVD